MKNHFLKKGTKWSLIGGTIIGILGMLGIKAIGDIAYNDGRIDGMNVVCSDINEHPEEFKKMIEEMIKQREK